MSDSQQPGLVTGHAQWAKGAAVVRPTRSIVLDILSPSHRDLNNARLATGADTTMQETIGNATGSDAWKSSGVDQKEAGLNEMKQAGEARKAGEQQGYGKVETMAGKAVGCEGMESEGKATEK